MLFSGSLYPKTRLRYTKIVMLFPDQSPIVLLAVVVALLALALMAAARDLQRPRGGPEMACPSCGLAFDAQRWSRRQPPKLPGAGERGLYHGRYTVTPLYTCPRCGETVHK